MFPEQEIDSESFLHLIKELVQHLIPKVGPTAKFMAKLNTKGLLYWLFFFLKHSNKWKMLFICFKCKKEFKIFFKKFTLNRVKKAWDLSHSLVFPHKTLKTNTLWRNAVSQGIGLRGRIDGIDTNKTYQFQPLTNMMVIYAFLWYFARSISTHQKKRKCLSGFLEVRIRNVGSRLSKEHLTLETLNLAHLCHLCVMELQFRY